MIQLPKPDPARVAEAVAKERARCLAVLAACTARGQRKWLPQAIADGWDPAALWRLPDRRH